MTEADAVAKLVQQSKMCELIDVGEGRKVLVTQHAVTANSVKPFLDAYLERPERKKGKAVLKELESFILHVQREKLPHSMIFLDPDVPRLLVVYDYQEPGSGQPNWRQHQAFYDFPLSEDWK